MAMLKNMQNLDNIDLKRFDMACFDECHNYGTKRLLPYMEHNFKYKMGLSATVERMDGAHLKILKAFNYNIFKYSPKQALIEDILNPFIFINIGIEMDEENFERYLVLTQELNLIMQAGGGFAKLMRSNTGLKYRMLSKMNDRKQLINNYYRKFDVVKEICLKHKNDKMLIFHQYNKQTSKTYWHLLDIGIKARVIHSGISKDKRDTTLTDYKNDKFNILLSTKVLDEGYNMPSIDCGVITAGDSSAKQTIQRLGRILRKKENPSTLYQLYVRFTIEEEYAFRRAKLFRELASDYKQYNFDIDDEKLF